MNESWATVFAQDYATWIANQLVDRLGWCSERTIYAAWNVGLSRVLSVKGKVSQLNPTTVAKCQQFSATRYEPGL